MVQRQDDAQITVRDRGCGLTKADADQVFEKYQQADPHGPGVGLGLYVARCLARALGGDLEVRPATGRGSEFRLTLPNAAVG